MPDNILKQTARMPYKLESAKILIVDDMQPMLSLTQSLLKLFGFKEVYTASDGNTGFDLFRKFSPDLVITDWVMEPVDGLEFIQRIRKDSFSPNQYVPIIIMTGYSSRIRVETARDQGITEFLVKPFTAKDLYSRIEHVIEKPRRFVDCTSFFGPDRRRKHADYAGPRRREADTIYKQEPQTDAEKAIAQTLRKLVDETRDKTK